MKIILFARWNKRDDRDLARRSSRLRWDLFSIS